MGKVKSGKKKQQGIFGLIDLVTRGEIPKDSTVLYAHLGGQPALNGYSAII
jgi:1-aminocyclopropane-1-carboxylate deaminase